MLVASADGVGTKLKVAFLANRHDTVGRDLVNHCVNDILVQGARPLFFLDYIGLGEMDEDVVPDIVTSAKSLGGGMPISAVTGRAEIMDAVHAGGLGGTFGGNPVAAAAALAVLDTIERDDLLARSRELGMKIMGRLETIAANHDVVGDVRGRGAMCAIELISDRASKEPLDADAMSAIARSSGSSQGRSSRSASVIGMLRVRAVMPGPSSSSRLGGRKRPQTNSPDRNK